MHRIHVVVWLSDESAWVLAPSVVVRLYPSFRSKGGLQVSPSFSKYFHNVSCGWFVNAAGLAVDAVPAELSFPGLSSELRGVCTSALPPITRSSAKLANSLSIHHGVRRLLSQ